MEKVILGSFEDVTFGKETVLAKIDTGADKTSIDLNLARRLGLMTELLGIKRINSSNGSNYRPIVRARFKVGNRYFNKKVTITKRINLNVPMIIGKDVLVNKFLVDVSK